MPWLIDPMTSFRLEDKICGEWLESIRKDIECFFGMLKARFRFFLNTIQFHSFLDIEKAFKTSCILHNMLLTYDGRDLQEWEKKIDWFTVNPDLEDDEDEVSGLDEEIPDDIDTNDATALVDIVHIPGINFLANFDPHYNLLRSSLVTHFYHQYVLGLVKWPSRSSVADRFKMRIPRRSISADVVKNMSLYSKPSSVYNRDGLFTCLGFKADEFVCDINHNNLNSTNDLSAYNLKVKRSPEGILQYVAAKTILPHFELVYFNN